MPRGSLICRECLKELSFVRYPICRKCGKQVLTETQKICYDCSRTNRSFSANRALLNYDDNARRCMVGIKYKNHREHVELFGKMMARRLGDFIIGENPDYLIPVPVHPSRLRARGYNQAELLAKVIGSELGIPTRTDILYRKKQTEAMKSLNPLERLANLDEAFAIEKDNIPSKTRRVMLVDDIYTTGATIETCSKILCSAGLETASICVCIGSDI